MELVKHRLANQCSALWTEQVRQLKGAGPYTSFSVVPSRLISELKEDADWDVLLSTKSFCRL